MQVDFEERVDFRRLHEYRLARTRNALAQVGAGRAAGVRPVQHPLHLEHGDRRVGARQADALVPADRQRRAVGVGFRLGRAPPQALRAVAAEEPLPRRQRRPARRDQSQGRPVRGRRRRRSRTSSSRKAWPTCRSASTSCEPPFLFALQKLGHRRCADGQQVMLDAREIKSHDEITLLNMAAAMGDGVYQDIFEALKPGVRENEIVAHGDQAALRDGLGLRRGDQRDRRRALQPAPAQLHRPPDPPRRPGVLRHHPVLHGLPDLLLPHVHGGQRHAGAARRLPARRASGWTARSHC